MVELSEHVEIINVFDDRNSTLYMVRSIQHKCGFYLKLFMYLSASYYIYFSCDT